MERDDPDHPARHPRRRIGHPAVAGVAAEPSQATARPHRLPDHAAADRACACRASLTPAWPPGPLLVTNEDYRFIVADQLGQVGISEPPHRAGAGGEEHRAGADGRGPARRRRSGASSGPHPAGDAFGPPHRRSGRLPPGAGRGGRAGGGRRHRRVRRHRRSRPRPATATSGPETAAPGRQDRAGPGGFHREARRGDRPALSGRRRLPLEQRHVHGQVARSGWPPSSSAGPTSPRPAARRSPRPGPTGSSCGWARRPSRPAPRNPSTTRSWSSWAGDRGRGRDRQRDHAPPSGAVVPLDAGLVGPGRLGRGLGRVGEGRGRQRRPGRRRPRGRARHTWCRRDSRLVAALGVEDLAIIETADAVLVAKRDRTADLKKLVDRLARTRREHHPGPSPGLPALGMVRVDRPGAALPGQAPDGRARAPA